MVPIGNKYYFEPKTKKVYRVIEIKPSGLKAPRFKLVDDKGTRRWVTLRTIEDIVAKKVAK